MNGNIQIVKGHILFTKSPEAFTIIENGYIVVEGPCIQYVGESLPIEYEDYHITDYGDTLIIPGFVDTHVHGPQYCNRGLGMDMELLPWLNTYTFPEEEKFKDTAYANMVYTSFVNDLVRNGTTRAVIYGTVHLQGTVELMKAVADAKICAYVGKVNMDQNSPEYLLEDSNQSIVDTMQAILVAEQFEPYVRPIITPRFAPTCSGPLMRELGRLAKKYNLPVQSHLSENRGEIDWVAALFPKSKDYTSVYVDYHLIGTQPCIMAHCIHLSDDEIDILAQTNTLVAHCPYSNNNLSSGIAPIRKLLERGVPISLGSDISGGHLTSMARVLTEAIGLSKMKWAEVDKEYKPLTLSEGFYGATRGGGQFFGNVGSFEIGYEFDALVIDDSSLFDMNVRSPLERLERWLYIGDDRQIINRYCRGQQLSI